MQGQSNNASALLQEHSISSVIVFPDLYSLGDYNRITQTLDAKVMHTSSKGGLYAEIYKIEEEVKKASKNR